MNENHIDIPRPTTHRAVWAVILSPEDFEKAIRYARNPDAEFNTPWDGSEADSFDWAATEEGHGYWERRMNHASIPRGDMVRCILHPSRRGAIVLDLGNAEQPFTRSDVVTGPDDGVHPLGFDVTAGTIGPGPHTISVSNSMETLLIRTARVTHLLPSGFFASFPDIESFSARIVREVLNQPGQSTGAIVEALCASENINSPFLNTRISWDPLEENPNTVKYRDCGEYSWQEARIGEAKLNHETNRMEGRVHPKWVHLAGMMLGCPVRVEV